MSLILDVVRRDLSHRRPNTAAAGLSRSKSEKDVTPYRPKTSHLQVREAFPARQLSPRSEEKQNQCKKNYGLYEQFLGTPCMPVPSIQTTRNPFASYEPRQPDKVRWKKLEETHRRKTATKDNGASARDTSISSQEKSMIKFRKQAGKFGVEQLGEQYHELKNKVWENYHTKAHKGARRRISVRIRSGSTIGLNDRRLEFVGDLQGSKGGEGGLMAVGGAIEKARAQRQAKLKQEHRNGFNYHESVFYQPSGDEKPLNNRSHQSKRGDRYDIKERSTHKNHYSKHQNQAVLHKHSNSVAPTSLTWGGTLKQIMPQGAEITQSVNQGEAAEAYLGKEAQQIEDLENEELFYEQLVSSGLEVFHLEGKDRTSRLKRHVDHRRRQRAALKKEREIERMRQRHLEALRKENERAMALELDVDAGVDVDLDRGGNEGNVFSAHAESSGAAARHTRLNYSSSSHQLRRYGVDTGGEMGGEHKHEHKNNNKHNNEHETRNGQGNGHGREKGMVKSYSLAVLDLHRQKMNELVPRSHRGFKPTGVTGLGSKQIRYSILQRDRIRSRKEALLAKTESHLTKLMQAMGEEVEQKKQLLGDGDDVPYWQREPEVGSESSKTEEDGAEKGGQANDSDAHVKNRKTETNKGSKGRQAKRGGKDTSKGAKEKSRGKGGGKENNRGKFRAADDNLPKSNAVQAMANSKSLVFLAAFDSEDQEVEALQRRELEKKREKEAHEKKRRKKKRSGKQASKRPLARDRRQQQQQHSHHPLTLPSPEETGEGESMSARTQFSETATSRIKRRSFGGQLTKEEYRKACVECVTLTDYLLANDVVSNPSEVRHSLVPPRQAYTYEQRKKFFLETGVCLDSKDAIKENARRRSAAEQQQEVAGFVSMNCMSSYIKYAREMQTQLGRAPVNDGPDNEDMFSSNPMAVFAYSSKKLAADQKKVKRNKKKRQPILTEKQLYSRDKGLKDSDVHVLNRIPAAKHEFQAVIRLGEDKCEHAFDEEIKEVAFSAIPLLALSDDDAKHGEKMAITAVYKKHYRLLRMLFQHYVVETSKAENSKQLNFLSSTGFQSFCKSCKITDRFLTSGVVGMIFVNTNSSESEAQKEKTRASNKKKSSKRTLRMVGRLSAMMPKKNNISGVGGRSGITKGDDDNGRALREVHGLSGEKNKSKSSSDDSMNPDKMFTRAEFLESLLRLALKKYESSRATPADKLDHLIKKCLITNGFSKKVFHITSAPFRRQLLSHGPQEVIKKHSKALWRLFNWVNSLDAEVSSSNDLTVSLKEMQSMCKRLGLLGTRLSWYKVVKSFTLACDENSEEMYELGYPSFVELLCRLGDMYTPSKRPNEPALSKEVAKKLDTFFTYLINTFQKKAK